MIKKILYKNNFTFEKYKELLNFANENNYQITEEDDCYLAEEKEKTLEELKEEKVKELKQARDDFKKTIIINSKTLYDIEEKEHIKVNMLLGIGFTEDDKLIFSDRLLYISNTYDKSKQEINNCKIKEELDKLTFNFNMATAQNVKVERKTIYYNSEPGDDASWAFSND